MIWATTLVGAWLEYENDEAPKSPLFDAILFHLFLMGQQNLFLIQITERINKRSTNSETKERKKERVQKQTNRKMTKKVSVHAQKIYAQHDEENKENVNVSRVHFDTKD
ncbi:hypothetical protein ACJX0J_038314, partial [Zea mays]